jgi:hypothetical protein
VSTGFGPYRCPPAVGYARWVDELPGSGRVRASDAERERVARFLATAFADGRLDLAEYDTRVAAAYAAVYRHELTALLDELPAPDRPLFDPRPATPVPPPAPSPVAREITPTPPAGVTRRDERLAPGWPLVLVMAGGALCLARLGFFGPLALLLVLGALATALGWISDESDRRRRRRRHKS